MKRLQDRVAVVTGGAGGIGLGMAQALSAAGCRVAILDVRRDAIDQALGSLDEGAMGMAVDISEPAAVRAAADEVMGAMGRVDVLCNNAGVNSFVIGGQDTLDDFDWIMGVNLRGTFLVTQAFLPHLGDGGQGGHIVFTSSLAAFLPDAFAVYESSKAAILSYGRSLRLTLAPRGIGVSVLLPGLVDSNIHRIAEVRPDRLGQAGPAIDRQAIEGVTVQGMKPREVGERVVEAILANRELIFTHGEHLAEMEAMFREILAEYPTEWDPARSDADYFSERLKRLERMRAIARGNK